MSYSRNQPVVKLLIFYWKPEIEKKKEKRKKEKEKKKRGFKLESNEFKKVPLAASFCREKKRFKLKKPLLSYQSQAFTQRHRKAKSKPWLWSPKILKTQTLLLILSCPGSGTLSLSVWSIQTNTLLALCVFNGDDFWCGGSDYRSIKKALQEKDGSRLDLTKLLSDCFDTFKDNTQYRNDLRFLKICFLYVISSFFFSHFSISSILP